MSLSFNFNFGRSAEQPPATSASSASSSPSSTASSDSAAPPPPPPPPPAAHPPCGNYLLHVAAHGLHPSSAHLPLPAACSRSSLHSCTSAADVRAAFTGVERLTAQHPHYVVGLADALQHDMAVVSAEVHSQPQPPQPLSPFADYFLHSGFSQSVRLLLQRYVELTSINATNGQSLVSIARGAGAKRTVQPFDLLRLYSALRDCVSFGCSVFGVVSGAARAVVVDVWSMLFKWNDAWQRIHAGSWVTELAVATAMDDKEGDEEEDEDEEVDEAEDEESEIPSTANGASTIGALSAVDGEKLEGAVMPTLVASTDAMSTLRSILVKRRSSTNKAQCDAAYEAEGESDEDIVSEESDNDAVYSDGDDDTDNVPRALWEPEPGADGYAADTAADVDMAKAAPNSPRTPPPPLTAPFSPAAATGTPRPLSPATTTEQDKQQLLVELDQYGQYRDVAWWRRKVAGEEGWQITMPPVEVQRESMAYPVTREDEKPAEGTLNDTVDAVMDDSSSNAAEPTGEPTSVPSVPRRLRKLSNSSLPASLRLPSYLFSDLPRSFSRWCASESDGLYYQELINWFGQQGGFHLLLSSLPSPPITTYRFLICRPYTVADSIILTPTEQATLQQTTDRPSLLYVRDLLGLVHALVGKPAAGLQLRIVLLFVARVVAYCLSLTDAQLQRESKQQVSELVTLCTLLAGQQSSLSLASHMERFESDFSLYLLRCASLEKRIHGLSHIKRLLEVEQDRRVGGLASSHGTLLRPLMDHSSPPYTRPVATPFVLLPSYTRYLEKAAVIETLFGEGLHVQLLRRSMSLLRCMAQQQCVSAQQLDCMWAATRGKHETVAAQVYGCMTAVIAVLPMAGLQHLFDRLSAVAVSEIDAQFVALVRCVVAAAIELHMPTQHDHTYCRFDPTVSSTDTDSLPARGLDFLWRLFNERQLPVDSLRQAAFEHLQALLLSDAACPFRRTYLLHCVDNVKRQWNVPHALWLLFDLTDTYKSNDTYSGQSATVHTTPSSASAASASSAALPTSPFKQLMAAGVAINTASALTSTPRHLGGNRRTSGVDDRSAVIDYLNADDALLSAFFLELSAFAAQPVGVAGVFPAAKTFEMRLIFLDYVYRYSKSLIIDYATVALLWSRFISPLSTAADSVTPPPSFDSECRDVLFCFLTSIFTSPTIDPSLSAVVFHQLVPLLPFTTLSQSGFMFFHLLFLSVNRSEGRIACHSPTPLTSHSAPLASISVPPTFTVRCAPSALSGFEYVWELACACVVDEVGNEATRMLQRLHAQVEASGLSGLTESYERCVAKAMERIVRVRAELEEASHVRKARLSVEIERCFNILNLLLDQPHYSHIASPTSLTSPTAVSAASVSPSSSSAPTASTSPVAGSSRLLAVPASQRCRPPHVCGALLYLSQDYPPLPPSAPAAYPIAVTINYPLSDLVMGQFDVRVSSHATIDELLIVIQQQSLKEQALLDLALGVLPPLPFPLIDLCEFGSDQSLTTRENRRKRLGELAPAPGRPGDEVKWELKLRCKSEEADCPFDPKHTCPACKAVLPLWVYHCRCGHDERLDEPPDNQHIWSETKERCLYWEDERRRLQRASTKPSDPFPLQVWTSRDSSPYPLPRESVWFRTQEVTDWLEDEQVNQRQDSLSPLSPEKQAVYLAAMRGQGETAAGAAAQPVEERKASGSGLKIVLRKDKDKEGEFSAGEMPSPAAADMDTDKQPAAVEQPEIKPPPATMSVVHPSAILSRVEYVDELFKLLAMSESDTQLSEKCWQLLMRLDINAQLLHRLHTLDEPHTECDWSALLDGRNVAKLQYSLIIVRLLMLGHAHSASVATSGKAALRVDVDGSGEQKARAGDEWQRRFMDKGGVSHLLRVLVNTNILLTIPLEEPSTQPSASCLSFHQSLALQCVMSLLAVCTDILRNPNVKQRRQPTAASSETTSSTPPSAPAPAPLTASPLPVAASEVAVSDQSDDTDMASENATKKRKDAVEAVEQPAKKLKPTDDDNNNTTTPTTTTTSATATAPADDDIGNLIQQSKWLFTPWPMSKLLSIMLYCAALPLYQPAPTVSAHSRSSDVLSSVLRAMDERIAEAAVDVEQILPSTNVASATSVAAAAPPSYIDSPTTAIAELALPSPSPTAAVSPLSPMYGPSFDPHRDEVSGVYSACVALVLYIASEVPTVLMEPFVDPAAIAALARTALLCSPRSCIRQCTNVLLLQVCYAAHRPPHPIPVTAIQSEPLAQYPLPQLTFALLLQLLTTTPLSELQGRWRHQTEPMFAVMIRLTNDYLWCDVDVSTQPPTPPQPQPERVHPLSVLLTLFNLIETLAAEREADATADQTAVGLLWLTALFVQLQSRIDARKPFAPPRLYGEVTSYPYDSQNNSALAARIAQCGIIPFLYTKGLFQVKPVHGAADLQSLATSPLFRFPSTRQAALELLAGLSLTSASNHTTLLSLSVQSHPHRTDLVAASQYNYQPSLQRKPPSCPHVGLHNLGATCFPERDTRILTNRGFLFLHEIEQCADELLYACYDVRSASIVYRPGKVVYAATPERWVDFTQSDTRRDWQCGSGDYDATTRKHDGNHASHLTLRTTPQHDMFVQPCVQYDDGYQSHSAARKLRAEELAPGYQCDCSTIGEQCMHGWPSYRMFTGASNGVHDCDAISLLDLTVDSPIAPLSLRNDDELSAFLALYGYWQNDGTMAYVGDSTSDANAVSFSITDERDRTYLLGLLARLPLKAAKDWTVGDNSRKPLLITNRRWFRFFDDEYGCMYRHSSHFDTALALRKQGMQPQPPHCKPLQSAKWLPDWVVHRLSKRHIRHVISGLRHSATHATQRRICTTGIALRDQLIQACLHAGFSAYFTLDTRAGHVLGYRCSSNDRAITYTEAEVKALLAADPARRFRPVVSRHDSWCIVYSDTVSHVLPAEDIRFDGKPAMVRSQPNVIGGTTVAVPTLPSDEYQPSDGRAWCVEVQHDDHLIFVQRAHTNQHGVVSKVGRVVITKNCYMNSLMQQLFFTPPFRYGLFVQRHWDAKPKQSSECSSSVVYQMQLLMAQLQESVQRFYDARSFCLAYRDYEGACLTGDHRVLTHSGWRSITALKVGDVVMSFNTTTYAMEWKPVTAVTSHVVNPSNADDTLYRMHGSGMDVIATRDHRMLLARFEQGAANGLQAGMPVGYETVDELLRLSYHSDVNSTVTSFAHNNERAVLCAGFNTQPAVKVVIPGLERVCDWWWDRDGQLGFLQFLGVWLSDGLLLVRHGLVGIGQRRLESCAWLETLLHAVFPHWWDRHTSAEDARGLTHRYVVRCPPLYDYLRLMAVGPVGYNPRDPSEPCNYPHFTKHDELAAKEQRSAYYKPNTARHTTGAWTEEAMLAGLTGSSALCYSPSSTTRSLHSAVSTSSDDEYDGDEEVYDDMPGWDEDEDEVYVLSGEALTIADAGQAQAMQAAGKTVWWNNGQWIVISGNWFCLKRWLGEQNVANVYSKLSRKQAIALLDGFCRMNGRGQLSCYDDCGEPTGQWTCSSSSFPLIDHLMLVGQLAGAAVDLHLCTKAGKPITEVVSSVDHWQLSFSFTQQQRDVPMQTAPLAQPVDVSDDIDGRGYYQYKDDGKVWCIQVQDNSNFLTQRLSTSLDQHGSNGVRAQPMFLGNCMALNTQMDVQEFANILFDQIEKELKQTNSHQLQLLNHVYGGKIVNQLICQQCGNRNERDEDYYMLSLDVKNKHSILNSLALYTDGELLEGDNKASCSRCNRKTETVKRVCVKTLPPHLILHLKRFEFDLDSMRKYKVNDYCEFPMELDLFPYTSEGIEAKERKERKDDEKDDRSSSNSKGGDATPVQPASYYQYTLSGVLVHTGTCNSGHYYSFVKDRTADGGWWSCNDTNVEVLNVDSIKESCYGGGEVVNTYDVHTRKPVTNFVSKPYSAYMLFYDRVEMKGGDNVETTMRDVDNADVTTAMQVDNGVAVTAAASVTAAAAVDRDVLAASPPSALPDLLSIEQAASLVPPLIFRSIWSDNTVFLSDCYIFDTAYFHFAYRLIRSGIDWWQAMPQHRRDERLQRYKDDESQPPTHKPLDNVGHILPIPYETHMQLRQPQQPSVADEAAPLLWSDDLLYHSGKFAINFLLHTYAHARCKSVLEGWDGWLRQMMDASYRLSCYLLSMLAVQREWMRALVLLSGVQSFRTKWNDIILAAMLKCQTVYEERYDAARQRGEATLPLRSLHPYIADYMYVYLSLLPIDVQENIKNAHTYFSFLLAFLQIPNQPHFTHFILRYPRLITTLLQFFLSSDCECPTTGVSYRRHPQVTLTTARDNSPLVAIPQDTRVLMADGSAKIARLVAEGEVLVGERGQERRVEEVHVMDEEVGEDEEREADEAGTDNKWRAFKVTGGVDYLLADLVVVRNDADTQNIGDRPATAGERDAERDESDDVEEEDEEEFDADDLDVVPYEFWHHQQDLLTSSNTGIPVHCIKHPGYLTLVYIHASLRKMKPLRKKFSDKLRPFASFLSTFLELSWQRCSPAQRSSFFPFLPFREARLLCHPELFAALLEIDANVSEPMFGVLCRNAPATVQIQVAQQLTDEIHKTAHGGLPHLFTLLYHFLAIDDALSGMRVRHGVKKLVVVIRKNEKSKYKDEYSAMINLTAYWIERKEAGGAAATGDGLISDRVQLLLRDELVASVVQWDKCAIWSEVAPFRAAGLRLLLALSEWRSEAERRDEMLEQREDEFRAMRVKIARQEGRPVKLINGVLDVYNDDGKADEQPTDAAATAAQPGVEYVCQAPPATRPYTRIFTYVLSHLPTLLKRDRLSMERVSYFVETYELLDQLLTTFPSLIALVTEQHVQAIVDAMELTMRAHSKLDPMKSITARLLHRLCTCHPPFVQLLTDSPTSRQRGGESLAGVFMFHDMGSIANIQYNETALTPVFQLLLMCCQMSAGFYVTLQTNPTFEWAIQQLLLVPPRDIYPSISEALLRLLSEMASSDDSGDWRRRMLSKWWPRAMVSRAHESQSNTCKQMEARLEPWIAVVERLARTNDDWKALGCSWFLLNLVCALETADHQKHSLQLHERVLALMVLMLLWYEAEELSGNEAVVKVWNEVAFSPQVRKRIAAYLPAILCQVRVVKPPPPAQPATATAAGSKAVTRSTGKQVGGAMAAKNVKTAAVPIIVPSIELRLPTRRLLNMSPVYRLSSKALIDGLCVCQLVGEGAQVDHLGYNTGKLKREQFKIDSSKAGVKDDSPVYYGSLLPDIYYDGYQSICAHYYSQEQWEEPPVDDSDRSSREEAAQTLLIFALEIAAAAHDTVNTGAEQQPQLMQQYAAWTTTELIKRAKQPTLYPATAVLQEPPPQALLVSRPTESRLALYLSIVNTFGGMWRFMFCQSLSVQLARLTCRRHRQLLFTPVALHYVASVLLSGNCDYDVEDALDVLDDDLRAAAERCIECGELQLLYRLLLLMKVRWRQEAMREEIVCEAADNKGGRYYEDAMDKLVELHEWLNTHTPSIEKLCIHAIQTAEPQQQQEERKADETTTTVHRLLDGDWLQQWKAEWSRRQSEWSSSEKARRERVAAARAEQLPIDDQDDDHYPPMLRFALPDIDQFQFNHLPTTHHIDLPHTDTLQTCTHIHRLLVELGLLHDRQVRIVEELYSSSRCVKQWSSVQLRRQRKEATGQSIGPDTESEEDEDEIAVEEDEQLSEASAKAASDAGEADAEEMEEEKSEEAK